MKISTIFIGTGEFCLPSLELLLKSTEFNLTALITQPDKPQGRKQILTAPLPKQLLKDQGKINIYQPKKLTLEAQAILEAEKPELIIVCAYGQIIPKLMLDYPKYGCLNIHGSLLPTYRGAVPIQMVLLAGDKYTGCSILKMTPGLDDGPVLAEKIQEISLEDDYLSLRRKLSLVGADLLISSLPLWIDGTINPLDQLQLAAQTGRKLSICKISDASRDRAQILISDDIQLVINKIRAFNNEPTAWVKINQAKNELKIFKARLVDSELSQTTEPQLISQNNHLLLKLKTGTIELIELQLAGKKRSFAKDYLYLAEKNN